MKLRNAYFASIVIGLSSPFAHAQNISDDVVKIGVINDMNGPYADITGKGSVVAAKMAIQDFGGKVLGKPIELLSVDHQNKADIGSTKAREWFDQQKVDMVTGLGNTSVHYAVVNVAKEKNKIVINTEAGTSAITGVNCAANVVHYTYDTYAVAQSTVKAMIEGGGKSWYTFATDYAFGQALANDVINAVSKNGGKLVGSLKHPLNASDFSSFMLTAQASNADVIALANGGADTINSIKTARQFGITDKQKVAAMLFFVNDVHALGLEAAQGLFTTTGFYWDRTPETRAWSQRYFKVMDRMPDMTHAGTYSAVTHYLKAVQAAGTDDTGKVMAMMKKMPIDDFFAKDGKIREDGRMVHDMYLVQVKKPSESKGPWDYFRVMATIPGEQAFLPMSEGNCPLVKK